MLLVVIHIVFGVFALIGLASVLNGMYVKMSTYCASGRYLFVILKGNDADLRLKATEELMRCAPSGTYSGILAVDFGMTDQMKQACRIITSENNAIEMYTAHEFSKRMRGEKVE